MKSVAEANVGEKLVLVRTDFDVPVKNGKITDDLRIKSSVKTIKLLLEKRAKLRIISHLGRPEGTDPSLSLKIVEPLLKYLLDREVLFSEKLTPNQQAEIILYENLRFFPEEERDDQEFAEKLAGLGEIYVNECFSVSHRAHASVDKLTYLLPAFAGLVLVEETTNLKKILQNPERPLVAIIGGAKIETKLPAITNLARIADKVLVGGRLMFEIDKNNLPKNVQVAIDNVDEKDIGEKSLAGFQAEIGKAKMLVWNGPMGKFEEEQYSLGTKELARTVADSPAFSVVGGGDTLSALDQLGLLGKISFVSMGGGAMLDFLSGKKLPGLESLGFYD